MLNPKLRKLKKNLPLRIAKVRGQRSQRQFARDLGVFQQNINRYDVHMVFLKAVFPERFGSLDQQTYLELVTIRATRLYYSGNFVRFDHPEQGVFYGFTVYTAASSEELLEVEEVRALHRQLADTFTAGPLHYTFEKWDAMARQKAETWTEPGFPIYFLD